MSMKPSSLVAHMSAAWSYSRLSHAKRQKVGAVLIKHDNPISCGCNGTYPGDDNCCEVDGVTKPDVIHAEVNCLDKLRFIHETSIDAVLVCTHEPCLGCAREIWKSKVKHVVFEEFYKSEKSPSNWDGIEYLLKKGVLVEKYSERPDGKGGTHFETFVIDHYWLTRARLGDVKEWPAGFGIARSLVD